MFLVIHTQGGKLREDGIFWGPWLECGEGMVTEWLIAGAAAWRGRSLTYLEHRKAQRWTKSGAKF